MYTTSRLSSPIRRSRNGMSRRDSATRGLSPSTKRRSLTISTSAPKLNGDYHVLKVDVDTKRDAVHQARAALATSLDQLGEHHVRQKEYDDAMDAFAESLREKRSIFSHLLPSPGTTPREALGCSPSSAHSGSFFGNDTISLFSDDDGSNLSGAHDHTIDQIVLTLRNMGNVHSLRGEQDEAMRYFSEVTSLRAQKRPASLLAGEAGDEAWAGAMSSPNAASNHQHRNNRDHAFAPNSNQRSSTISADETSTLMSEISEDVKALDDLFQSISFRNQGAKVSSSSALSSPSGVASPVSRDRDSVNGVRHARGDAAGEDQDDPTQSSPRRRTSSRALGSASHNSGRGMSNKRRKGCTSSSASSGIMVDGEGFKRSTSSASKLAADAEPGRIHELQEALAQYARLLDTTHSPRVDEHREYINSLNLRADLIVETKSRTLNDQLKCSLADISSSVSKAPQTTSNAAALELALEVYHHILRLYNEEEDSNMNAGGHDMIRKQAMDMDMDMDMTHHFPILTGDNDHGGDVVNGYVNANASETLADGSTSTGKSTSASTNTSTSTTKRHKRSLSGRVTTNVAAQQLLEGGSSEMGGDTAPSASEVNRNGSTTASGDKDDASSKEQQQHREKVVSDIATVLICMGSIYYKLGDRVKELEMYKRAKVIYQRTFGENHVYVAGTSKNIGTVMAERGEYEDAMEHFEKAKEIYLAVSGNDQMNRDVASAISCMGNVKNRVGELDAALSHYMEALSIYKSVHEHRQHQHQQDAFTSQDHDGSAMHDESGGRREHRKPVTYALRDVTSTLKIIGMVHAKKGDLDTAMRFFQEAMSILRSSGLHKTSVGRETTASVLTRIANIHMKKLDLDQAMSHYREAYDLTVRNRGTTNHPEVAGILHYIGAIYSKRGDYDEAMACYQEGIRIYHATLGPGNPAVAGTLVMVGTIHYKKRNLDSAMMFYREALRLNRDAYGLHHPDVAPILRSIGTILTKQGHYVEAYDVFRDVLSIKCAVHGTCHADVASAYKNLGNIHYKLGDLADAERQYRHALSIYRRIRGEDHSDTIAARTTIEHLRYWMKEREQRHMEERHSRNSSRSHQESDERSC